VSARRKRVEEGEEVSARGRRVEEEEVSVRGKRVEEEDIEHRKYSTEQALQPTMLCRTFVPD